MVPQNTPSKQRTAAALNIIAGVLFLAAGLNVLHAWPGINWFWLVMAVVLVAVGIWGLRR